MENPVENEAKERVRLTGLAYQLIEKVRQGGGTYDEVRLANYLYRVDRCPGIFLRRVKRGLPAVEGSFNSLLREEYLEMYQDKGADLLESEVPHLVGKEEGEGTFSELDEFEILEKGKALLEWLSQWREIAPPNDKIAYYLDKVEKGEEVPFWSLKGLVRDGFIQKIEEDLGEEFEVELL